MTSMPSGGKMVIVALLIGLGVIAIVQWLAIQHEFNALRQYPPSGQFVDTDGTRIHVKISGTGPDLVLIHGASGSLRDFTFDLVARLEQDFRVIAFDRPGLGYSERPEGYGGAWNSAAESPAMQARILQKAADAVGAENPIVLGFSYGGAVALAWALERPKHTAALVLLASVSNPWPGELGLLYRVNSSLPGSLLAVPLITALTPEKYVRRALDQIYAPQSAPDGYFDHFGSGISLRRGTLRANAQQVNNLRPYIVEMAKKYPTLTLPVEIVHGTEDTTVPMHIHSEPLAEQIPGAVLTRLPGVGHVPHHADPEAVIAAIHRAATRAGLR